MALPSVYAHKGERVTCESGHHILTIVQDIPAGAEEWWDSFSEIGSSLSQHWQTVYLMPLSGAKNVAPYGESQKTIGKRDLDIASPFHA